MSGTGEGQRARGGYDPAELCRCIVVSFSTTELRQLAESMDAAEDISWGRGTSDAARDLVRHFERKRDLERLVAKLREAKPLVEWPESSEPASPYAPTFPTSAPLDNPGVLVGQEAPPLLDPYVQPPAPPAATQIEAKAEGVASEKSPRASRPPAAPSSQGFSWPGTVGGGGAGPEGPSRGIDPKILVIVSGVALLAALIAAFIAGRAGAPSASSSPGGVGTASADAKSGDQRDGDGAAAGNKDSPAGRLADDIARSLANVARACEIPVQGAPGEDVLLRAFDQCGPQAAPVRSQTDPLPPDPSSPAAKPLDNDDRGAAQRPAQTPRRDAPKPSAAEEKGPGSVCMRGCDSEHASCRSRCGKEPTQSTLYGEYTSCLSRCLSSASRCRLNCK